MNMPVSHILHADCDETIKPFFTRGETYAESVIPDHVPEIKDRESIVILTVKSQSRITDGVLRSFPNLKLLITRTVGTDHIDLPACQEAGIEVKNIPDYDPQTVAEHALSLILACSRMVLAADREVRSGRFSYRNFPGISLAGKTVGILGTGRIGLTLTRVLKPFGVSVIGYDVMRNERAATELGFRYVDLAELLAQSDIVSVHIPLTAETTHLLDASRIALMKSGSILVNTSRGGVIDTGALVSAAPKFLGIGLDVIEGETEFSQSHPILAVPNVVLTPHMGFFSDNSVRQIAAATMAIIDGYEQRLGQSV